MTRHMTKQYKVEARTFYSKPLVDKNHIATSSAEWVQKHLDHYAQDGWTLTSTDATSLGFAIYVYLYFEKG